MLLLHLLLGSRLRETLSAPLLLFCLSQTSLQNQLSPYRGKKARLPPPIPFFYPFFFFKNLWRAGDTSSLQSELFC